MKIVPNLRYNLLDLEGLIQKIKSTKIDNIWLEIESENNTWKFYLEIEFLIPSNSKIRYYIRNNITHEVIFYYPEEFKTTTAKSIYYKFKWKK